MKRLSILSLTLLVFAVAPSLQANSLLRGDMMLNFHGENWPDGPIWIGTITGDLNGEIFFTNTGGALRGLADHFEETWLITGEGGNMLAGTDEGVVSLANSKYRMNGVVTEAAGEWAHLIGRQVHASGYITWDGDMPLTAPGTFQIE